jgi:hypothetical protein
VGHALAGAERAVVEQQQRAVRQLARAVLLGSMSGPSRQLISPLARSMMITAETLRRLAATVPSASG